MKRSGIEIKHCKDTKVYSMFGDSVKDYLTNIHITNVYQIIKSHRVYSTGFYRAIQSFDYRGRLNAKSVPLRGPTPLRAERKGT